MRLFVIIRSIFFTVLLAASWMLVFNSQLCINYVPHQLEDCEQVVESISKINHDELNVSEKINSNRATRSGDEKTNEFGNSSLLNSTNSDKMQSGNVTMVDKWHNLHKNDESITINVKSCFDFSVGDIISGSKLEYSSVLTPLRLILILIVTSFLVAILDLSARMIVHPLSMIQCVGHSFIQFVLWGTILVKIEMYRRGWIMSWLTANQPSTEIPMYPTEWATFELFAFFIMLLSITDSLFFKHLLKKVKLVKSEGVYRCIDQDST
ncbi:hypothetical protein GCK72_019283 [Caenorhabditis remanei]|uniref:Uncharacterized protein n=1 Tax=Caenorhabditis remanei TaxID=31234 RepID=A0A6A5GC76_CAERE|nr:hypothetical protein GCK72_019283 [Caenorhabditis remanei]KAF1752728.1 hypothetical protein GCK72_019283 [Caenorhabditis remanei]